MNKNEDRYFFLLRFDNMPFEIGAECKYNKKIKG